IGSTDNLQILLHHTRWRELLEVFLALASHFFPEFVVQCDGQGVCHFLGICRRDKHPIVSIIQYLATGRNIRCDNNTTSRYGLNQHGAETLLWGRTEYENL